MAVLREAFEKLAGDPRPTATLTVSELGGEVRVQAFTALDHALYISSLSDEEGKLLPPRERKKLEKLAVRAVIDDDGKKLFTKDDLDMLSRLPAGVLNQIQDKVSKISGFNPDLEADLEDREKN